MGISGSCGLMLPASNIIARFVSFSFWANMAAAQGAPVPTASVEPFLQFPCGEHRSSTPSHYRTLSSSTLLMQQVLYRFLVEHLLHAAILVDILW